MPNQPLWCAHIYHPGSTQKSNGPAESHYLQCLQGYNDPCWFWCMGIQIFSERNYPVPCLQPDSPNKWPKFPARGPAFLIPERNACSTYCLTPHSASWCKGIIMYHHLSHMSKSPQTKCQQPLLVTDWRALLGNAEPGVLESPGYADVQLWAQWPQRCGAHTGAEALAEGRSKDIWECVPGNGQGHWNRWATEITNRKCCSGEQHLLQVVLILNPIHQESQQHVYSQLMYQLSPGDAHRRHKSHPVGQPAMLVALATAFDCTKLEYDGLTLRKDAKPRVRMQQLAFAVYKVRWLPV